MMRVTTTLLAAFLYVSLVAATAFSFSHSRRVLHVRVTDNERAVRNNGGFSVSGPCGGADTWGQGSKGATEVANGQRVCAMINYNGGHKSPANAFRAVFACGGNLPQNSFKGLSSLPLVDGTSPSELILGNTITAAGGNNVKPGYTLCVDLPPQTLTDENSKKCTLSLLDQRDWGGCLDFALTEPVPTPPPTPAPTPTLEKALEDASGAYQAEACSVTADCTAQTCCMIAKALMTENGGIAIKVEAASVSCPAGFGEWNKEAIYTKMSPDEVLGGDLLSGTFKVRMSESGDSEASLQPFTISFKEGAQMEIVNDASDRPLICDQKGLYRHGVSKAISDGMFTAEEAEEAGKVGEGGGMSGFGKFVLVVLSLSAVYLGLAYGGFVPKPQFMDASSSSSSSGKDIGGPMPNPAAAPPPLPPKDRSKEQLPAGWEAHVDPEVSAFLSFEYGSILNSLTFFLIYRVEILTTTMNLRG